MGTSPGDDDEGRLEHAGRMADDWVGVARGERSARWGGGRFRNVGADRGCMLMLASLTALPLMACGIAIRVTARRR